MLKLCRMVILNYRKYDFASILEYTPYIVVGGWKRFLCNLVDITELSKVLIY
jgi:hypothetical protein